MSVQSVFVQNGLRNLECSFPSPPGGGGAKFRSHFGSRWKRAPYRMVGPFPLSAKVELVRSPPTVAGWG